MARCIYVQEGGRPLHFAAHLGCTDVVEMLLEQYGADATLASDVSDNVKLYFVIPPCPLCACLNYLKVEPLSCLDWDSQDLYDSQDLHMTCECLSLIHI